MGLMNYRHAMYILSGSKIVTETCLMNYRHDSRMSGEQKIFEKIENDRLMSD